ncbi:MAG: zf-HC2 domain-containing protein [Candidatus Poribacteria bacterium]|nr:zf-HC2 domain-containing protein [Candidatus Poribacteria bacterium]MDE0506140.1 zf-HC2 domain-containing protein [Candidatus Poribacteria bacterium]
MNCLIAEEHFSAYLEDELDYQTIKDFEAHLVNCGSCSSEFALFRKSLNLLHQLPRIEPSSDFDQSVRSRVDNLDVGRTSVWHQVLASLRSRPGWAFSGFATALFVVLISAYFYQKSPNEHQSSPPSVVIQANSNPTYQPADKIDDHGLLPVPVHQVHVPLDFGSGGFFGREVLEWRPQRTQQNFILQTVNYSTAPRGGGL